MAIESAMQPDVSIVVVSYNTLEMTRECLRSIYENSAGYTLQLIVVDNDSRDGSVDMIRREFPSAQLIANPDNRGFAVANNQGFQLAQGRYILLLNSDTVVLGDVIGRSIRYLDEHPQAGAMGCRVLNTDRTMQPTCSGYPTVWRLAMMTLGLDRLLPWLDSYRLRRWQRDDEREVEVISGCYLLVRPEILKTVGCLDESFFFFGEETDWCLRMRQAGWRLMFAPIGEIIHHGGGSVRKLNFKRDQMLTAATVRLHRKHGGRLAAALAFSVLAGFNFSRAVFWSLLSLLRPRARTRAGHFWNVVAVTASTWPKGAGK